MTHKTKLDKRSKRTRAWLLEALLELIKTKDYAEISVKELTEKADVARQTFYRNYESMDDILLSKMDEILEEYINIVRNKPIAQKEVNWDFEVKQLIYLCQNNKSLFKAFQKAGLSQQAQEKLSAFFLVFHKDTQNIKEMDAYNSYLVYNLVGGIYTVLIKWLEDDMKAPIGIIIGIFRKSAEHINNLAKISIT